MSKMSLRELVKLADKRKFPVCLEEDWGHSDDNPVANDIKRYRIRRMWEIGFVASLVVAFWGFEVGFAVPFENPILAWSGLAGVLGALLAFCLGGVLILESLFQIDTDKRNLSFRQYVGDLIEWGNATKSLKSGWFTRLDRISRNHVALEILASKAKEVLELQAKAKKACLESDDPEFLRRKADLMQQLKHRYATLLQLNMTPRNESTEEIYKKAYARAQEQIDREEKYAEQVRQLATS